MRVERIVEFGKKLGADDVIATSIEEKTKQVRFANGEIVAVKDYDLREIEVFMALKKRLIFGNVKSLDDLRKLAKIAKYLEPKKDYHGIAKDKFLYKPIEKTYDPKLLDLDVNEIVKQAIDHSKFKKSAGVLYLREYRIIKSTSGGAFGSDRGTSVEFSFRSFVNKYASGHSVSVSRTLSDFDFLKAVEEADEYAKRARNPKKGHEGKYDVIFAPLAFGDILSQVGDAVSAYNVDAGFSCFTGKITKKVASDLVNIYDDGRMPNGLNTVLFDEEGVPTRKTDLIVDGTLKSFLHSTSTAKKYKTETTGNAGIISPRPWNIVLKPGDYTLDEMIKEVKNGILITNVWYTRFTNYFTGDFSTIPRDAMIEIKDGKLGRAVAELRVSDNILRILENVKAISSIPKQVKWWEMENPVTTGFVLVKKVHLSSPGNV